MDVSGSPCYPRSRASGATRLRRKHPDVVLFLSYCAVIRAAPPRVAIHENVVGFDTSLLEENLGHLYHVSHVRVSPSDLGFPMIRRPRIYSVLLRRDSASHPVAVQALYDALVADLRYSVDGSPSSWLWGAPSEDLLAEENRARAVRQLAPLTCPSTDWRYLLTAKQRSRLEGYLAQARAAGKDLDRVVVDLGVNPTACSGISEGLPALRCTTTRLWSPPRRRWMVPTERLAAMGFPVFDGLAESGRVFPDTLSRSAPQHCTGNAMHVANVGVMMALGWLLCGSGPR